MVSLRRRARLRHEVTETHPSARAADIQLGVDVRKFLLINYLIVCYDIDFLHYLIHHICDIVCMLKVLRGVFVYLARREVALDVTVYFL